MLVKGIVVKTPNKQWCEKTKQEYSFYVVKTNSHNIVWVKDYWANSLLKAGDSITIKKYERISKKNKPDTLVIEYYGETEITPKEKIQMQSNLYSN